MATYETDEEQVEALKNWWKENGTSVVAGVTIGFVILFGWRWWQSYTNEQAEMASGLYQRMLFSLEKEESKPAREFAGRLLSEYSNSPYAVLAVLNLAHQDLEEGEIDSSHARLQWVIDQNSSLPDLTHIARLRKARLFLSQDKVTEANNLITGIDVGAFKGSYAELQGDIALIQGKIDAARTAYTEALESDDLSWQHRELVQMKLDDLGAKKEKRIEAIAPISATGNPTTTQDDNSALQMEESTLASATGNPSTTQDDNSALQMEESALASATGNPSTASNENSTLQMKSTLASATGNPSTTQNENSTLIESTAASSHTEDTPPASILAPE